MIRQANTISSVNRHLKRWMKTLYLGQMIKRYLRVKFSRFWTRRTVFIRWFWKLYALYALSVDLLIDICYPIPCKMRILTRVAEPQHFPLFGISNYCSASQNVANFAILQCTVRLLFSWWITYIAKISKCNFTILIPSWWVSRESQFP